MLRIVLVLLLSVFFASCSKDKEDIVVESTGFSLSETSFSYLSGWESDNLELFDKTIKNVCNYLVKNKADKLKSNKIEYSLKRYKKHCKNIISINNNKELKKYIEYNFVPYKVSYNGNDTGKFTSYYEAEIRGSFVRDGKYKYPIYGKPDDFVEINLRDFDSSLPNQRLVGRVENGKLVKYYTRKEIEEGKINAPVVLWGDNLVDIYLMQIQGSAVATLPDGRKIRVGYSDNNGYKFRGIGSILLEKGLIKPKDASMVKIREWLENNGDVAQKNMLLNDRYIFHKIVDAEGPIGAMGLPLFAGRSMAVDRDYIPLGTILWLETNSPIGKLNKLVIAEDVGSAIKGPIRGDYFWGYGDRALEYAGKMNASGTYYVILPKNSGVKFYE